LGYVRYRELEEQLNNIQTSCPNCLLMFNLSELRKHSETCTPMKQKQEIKPGMQAKRLSESQAKALQKAQEGENRSTFQCPFCPRAK
jgi:acetyl-CoA carboxylase beta subunit